jgi:hypothetical protein
MEGKGKKRELATDHIAMNEFFTRRTSGSIADKKSIANLDLVLQDVRHHVDRWPERDISKA